MNTPHSNQTGNSGKRPIRRGRPPGRPAPNLKTPPRPELQPFIERLKTAMKAKGMRRNSDLAREVWGTTKNKRGYDVARNRDRIGHYLAGTSYPDPENLRRLADALDVPVDELAIDRLAAERGASSRSTPVVSPADEKLILTWVPGQPSRARLELDMVIPRRLAMRIQELLETGEEAVVNPTAEEPK